MLIPAGFWGVGKLSQGFRFFFDFDQLNLVSEERQIFPD
jgi:hypothetical protein